MTIDGKAPMCGWNEVMACDECTQASRTCYHDRHPWDTDKQLADRLHASIDQLEQR